MITYLLSAECFASDPGARQAFIDAVSSETGDTALIWAVRGGQVHVVLEMMFLGLAEPDQVNYLGSAAIHIATSLANTEMVDTLLEIGGGPDIRNAAAKTALHLAARQNNFGLIRRLLRAGVHPDLRDIQGYTALHRAASLRAGAAVKALLDSGATIEVRDNAGGTAAGTLLRMATQGQSTGGALGVLLRFLLQPRA